MKMIKGKPMVSGAWNEFLEQANAANDVLDSHFLNGNISFTTLEARFNDVRRTYGAAVQQDAVDHAKCLEWQKRGSGGEEGRCVFKEIRHHDLH